MAITTELVGKLGGGVEWHTEVFDHISITAYEVKKTLTPTAGKVILASVEAETISVSNDGTGVVNLVSPHGNFINGSYNSAQLGYDIRRSTIGVKATIWLASDTRLELLFSPPWKGTAVASASLRWCEVDL
jgi:hypothetical protein